jgi:hypothetical protein
MRKLRVRLRAIGYALWYGLLPWWCYEQECHYAGMSYGAHLLMNLGYAWVWATWQEDAEGWEFEADVNNNRP